MSVMSTQDVLDAVEDANERVRETARLLRLYHRTPVPELCKLLHMSQATWYSRQNGTTQFTAGELAGLSKLWGVRVSDFFEGRVVLPGDRNTPGGSSDIACTRKQSRSFPAYRAIVGGGLTSAPIGRLQLVRLPGRELSVSSANDHPGNVA